MYGRACILVCEDCACVRVCEACPRARVLDWAQCACVRGVCERTHRASHAKLLLHGTALEVSAHLLQVLNVETGEGDPDPAYWCVCVCVCEFAYELR